MRKRFTRDLLWLWTLFSFTLLTFYFICSITIASLNDQRQAKHTQTTDIQCLSLEKNQEIPLIFMEQELTYPLHISVNLLVVSPNKIRQESTPSVPHKCKESTDSVSENENSVKSTSESNFLSSWVCPSTKTSVMMILNLIYYHVTRLFSFLELISFYCTNNFEIIPWGQ